MKDSKKIPWELIVSKFEGRISPDDECLLEKWLTDHRNSDLYNEIRATWQATQKRASGYFPDKYFYWGKLAKKLNLASSHSQKRSFLFNKSFQAAACIAMLLMCSASFYLGIIWDSNKAQEQVYTNVNGKSQITLPDGTIVWLHDQTTLSYTTDFHEERTVNLEGEAFFEVEKDGKRKFVVNADDISVMVYGTKFNVSSRDNKEEAGVSLLEGSVALSTVGDNKEYLLQPGETATYDKKTNLISIRKSNEIDAAWAAPTIQFSNRSLKEISNVLSHRYGMDIHVDSSIGDKYMYTFKLHDETIYEILTLMASVNSFTYEFQHDGSIIISK